MKQIKRNLSLLLAIFSIVLFYSCSKSSSNNIYTGTNPNTALFPLNVNNSWYYKLKTYDTSTGAVLDSSYFTLTITGTVSANGNTYYQFQNSIANSSQILIAALNNTTLGTVDSAYGINYHTFFVSGTGDSTQSVSSWPDSINANGVSCQGTDKLYAYYADTTLINEDGIVYTNSIKNIIETYDCSGNKYIANVYYVEQGVGLVRYALYVYSPSGVPVLYLAWVLESETLK
jgi:hypothetical protein